MPKTTTTLTQQAVRPVATLRIDVIAGPDKGNTATGDVITVGTAHDTDLVLTDPTVSRYHAELARDEGGVIVTDHDSTNGTRYYDALIHRLVLPAPADLVLGATTIRVGGGEVMTVPLHDDDQLEGLRGSSAVMRRLMAKITKVASSDAGVLLVGESGTGKERIARAIHDLSPRHAHPFEIVDCAALSPNLIASELFGHEKGAFTGAHDRRKGAFERANGGTLFLDEVGELPSDLQPTLLGALERRRFRRVGGQEEIAVDVRVVSATHRDIRSAINSSLFRLDLYYRLAVVRLSVPPLRERLEDLPLLIEHFLRECGHQGPVSDVFSARDFERFRHHRWPGNVRELRNLVDASVAMGEPSPVDSVLPPPPDGRAPDDPDTIRLRPFLDRTYKDARNAVLHEFEARYLPHVLEAAQGNITQAAELAGMDRSYLSGLVKRHGLR